MDLPSFLALIRRRWLFVLVGMLAAALLAGFALVRVSASGVELRSPGKHEAKATLFVTQPGFPWGRSVLTDYLKATGTGPDNPVTVPRYADPQRFQYLAAVFAQIATTDVIKKQVEAGVPLAPDSYDVTPVIQDDGTQLPLITVSAISTDGPRAVTIANRVADVLAAYVKKNQGQAKVPANQRIEVPVIGRAKEAALLEGPKLITPFMVFVLGAFLTLAFAAARDNIRRRKSPAEGVLVEEQPVVQEAASPEIDVRRRKRAAHGTPPATDVEPEQRPAASSLQGTSRAAGRSRPWPQR